ncbi:MAG: type II toxin-antitoxin system RelE/ParE family toxin [Acidobacteriota bacterium]
MASQPRPNGCEKLSGQERYRVRQGDHRIVYSGDDDGRVVEIVKIGRRGDVYRRA